MKALAEEAARLVESLPADKAQSAVDYARYLAEKADEAEWDRLFNSPCHRRKLKARMAAVEREIAVGHTEPLDLKRL